MKRTTHTICAVLALLMLAGCATKQPKPTPKDINHDGNVWLCEQLTGTSCKEK